MDLRKFKSYDSASSVNSRRRRSSGAGWFKRLFSRDDSAASTPSSRRDSVSSVHSDVFEDAEEAPPVSVSRKTSFKDNFLRKRSASMSNAEGRGAAAEALHGTSVTGGSSSGGSGSTSTSGPSGTSAPKATPTSAPRAVPGSTSTGSTGSSTSSPKTPPAPGTGTGTDTGSSTSSAPQAVPGASPGGTSITTAPSTAAPGSPPSSALTGPTIVRAPPKPKKRRKVSTKGVGFALSTFYENPPQRIPPANPEEGNVIFTPTGEVKILKRNKRGQKEAAKVIHNHYSTVEEASEKAAASAARLMALVREGQPTTTTTAPASPTSTPSSPTLPPINTALGANREPGPASPGGTSPDVVGSPSTKHGSVLMAQLDVDGEKYARKLNYTEHHEGDAAGGLEMKEHEGQPVGPPPDQVYARCCHLREIMPIRNILKQLQGQVAPIPRLRIANTKPTLVEIQAFSDFLSVVPVAALIVENHIITDEMMRLLTVALARSKEVCRLSFANTELSDVGWEYLCAYLRSPGGQQLLALNLGCTNPTAVPQKIPAFDRREMDWDLFINALSFSGTLEELDLGGAMIPAEKVRALLEGFQESGQILSLANNQLQHAEVKFVADWAQMPESHVMGLNLGGNNLSRPEDRYVLQQLLTNSRLIQLSLRNANFTAGDATQLLKVITPAQASLSSLRQLDLSNNPGLFPSAADHLFHLLPKFPSLARLQFEQCGLSSELIISLCECLSHCHRLVYLNLLNNEPLSVTAATALLVAVHLSRSICTVEADLEPVDPAVRQQLAKYCLQNLENNTGALADQGLRGAHEEDENADIISFYDDLVQVRKELSSISATATPELVRRIDELRDQINKRLQSILAKRKVAPPTTKDRVGAIRLLFYTSSLDKLKQEITLAKEQPQVNGEEKVKNVDEASIPPLHRHASEASIISLKKLEREEGESHKALAHILDMQDEEMLDAMRNLKVHDLESLMS